MSDRGPRKPPDRSEPEVEIRVLRVEKASKIVVRTLSNRYGGCFTHYTKDGSKYCPGRDDCNYHRLDRVWKGYACVEKYEQTSNLWLPFVLEITEALEQDLRGRWQRGQVWQLERDAPATAKKKPPVRGKLIEECNPDTFPPAFNLQPVLLWLYRVHEVRLDHENPMPARVRLAPSPGPAPRSRQSAPADVATPEQNEVFRKQLQDRMGGLRMPPSENGSHV